MLEEKKNGRWRITVGEMVTILVIVTGFVTNYAVRGAELRALSERVDHLDAALASEQMKMQHHEENSNMHYTVDSPAMKKLDLICENMNSLKGEVIKMQTMLLNSKGR